ncbi:hypothetical protein NL676_007422 [Syzygium grande]|nr:hypothetical protein NL676_007422 [Syzygium grande]
MVKQELIFLLMNDESLWSRQRISFFAEAPPPFAAVANIYLLLPLLLFVPGCWFAVSTLQTRSSLQKTRQRAIPGDFLRWAALGSCRKSRFANGFAPLEPKPLDSIMDVGRVKVRSAEAIASVWDDWHARFHQCVCLARFENDRTISFIPPDGSFDLMTYRLSTQVKRLIWVEAQVERHSRSCIEIMVKARSQFKERRCCT